MLFISGAWADSLRVSVLTCSPGPDAYAHFGHTAIRVTNYDREQDIVFNYGCFDYNEHMFIYKFIKGETDYLLEAETALFFFHRYTKMGIQVEEQVLNITQNEANTLLTLLAQNLQPENKEYRYNYLYDNCTTRARDMIEKSLTEELVYKKKNITLTARNELHENLEKAHWLKFGIDLVLGQELDDKKFDKRHQMFIPSHYAAELDSAYVISDDGTRRPVISTHEIVVEANPTFAEKSTIFTPTNILAIIFIVVLYVSIMDFINKKITFWVDILLSMAQGLAGIIVAFLFFFSEHPGVDSNWLVIILNPLYIVYAVYLIYCMTKEKRNILASVNLAVMVVFSILVIFVPQSFDVPTLILVLILLIRSISVNATEMRIARKIKK